MSDVNQSEFRMPKTQWQKATCEVCGQPFDYASIRRPRICRSGDCRYRFHYKIEPKTWASYQPTLFDKSEER